MSLESNSCIIDASSRTQHKNMLISRCCYSKAGNEKDSKHAQQRENLYTDAVFGLYFNCCEVK